MPSQKQFFGRIEEISKINELIDKWGTSQLILVSGEGGIGKTRLLKEIQSRSHNKDLHQGPIYVPGIIDFDDPTLQSPGVIRRKVSKLLGDEHFESYLNTMLEWRKLELSGAEAEGLEQKGEEIHEKFIECFNRFSAKNRVLLFFDTTDSLDNPEVKRYLSALISELSNCVIVIAGRDAKADRENLEHCETICLGPLNKQASMELLKHKLKSLSSAMEPDFVEKVIYLSEGKPILMELTLDWLVHGVPLEWLVESDLKEIKETKEERRKEFEAQLVSSITQMRSPMDQLVLKMAHVYPLTEDMAEEILDKPVGDVSHLFEHAKSYAFVKVLPDDRISLHDEMRKMVQEYVWDEIDPIKTQRETLSNIAASFYKDKVKALKDRIRNLNDDIQADTKDDSSLLLQRDDLIRLYDTANLQWLKYTLQAQIENGIDLYKNLEEKARNEHRIRFVQKLTRLVRRRIDEFNSDQRYEINVRYGRLLNDMGRGNAQTAKNLFTEMLNEYKNNSKRAAQIYHLLGVSEVALGQFNLALEHEKKSLDLFKQLHDLASISILENYIGYINRLKGEWRRAIEYYHRAIQSALEMNTFRPAGIYNNLGYVYGLMGKYGVAEDYCEDAIEIWKEENHEKGVIRGEVTLANIYRDAGEYRKAISKFQKAINTLDLPDDYVTLIRAYFGLAWTQWFEGENEKVHDKLLQAKANFDRALALAKEYNFIVELPGILHQASNVYWLLGEKEKARSLNEEAYELSKVINDIRYAVDSLVGFAEFDYKDGKCDNIENYAEELRSSYENKGYEFPLFYGRMRRILADVAFDRCEYKKAFEFYAKGIAIMSQHGGWGRYNFGRELQNLETRIKSLSNDEVNNWIDKLVDYWSKNASENKVADLVRWCYTVKNSLFNN